MAPAVATKIDWVDLNDYLQAEADGEQRHEYVAGRIYAMAGASETHNTIVQTLGSAIDQTLPNHCRVWQADMKLRIDTANDTYCYYPDIMAACSENRGDPYTRTDPVLVVEVLSPTTQRIDLGEKFEHYTTIDSLQEYLVVHCDTPHLQLFRRNNGWRQESLYREHTLQLESVGLTMGVESVYRRVRREVGLELPYLNP